MTHTKKQHYIPQCLLRNFTFDKKKRYCYEYNLSSRQCYQTNVANTMCANNIYEHPLLGTNYIENYFANSVDSELGQMSKEIINLLDNQSEDSVQSVKRILETNLFSIIRCYFRSGAILEEYNTAFRTQKGKIILHVLLNTPFSYVKQLCNTIKMGYKFAIISNADTGFVIGDQFLATASLNFKALFSNASNRQIGMSDTILILPISTQYCAVYYHGTKPNYIFEDTINTLNNEQCMQVNLAIWHSAYGKIVGNSKDVLLDIAENAFIKNYKSATTTVMTYESGRTVGHVTKREAFFHKRDYEVSELVHGMKFDLSLGRNDLCFCGSGQKHKKCCLEKTEIIKTFIQRLKNDRFMQTSFHIDRRLFIEESISVPYQEYTELMEAIEKAHKEDVE